MMPLPAGLGLGSVRARLRAEAVSLALASTCILGERGRQSEMGRAAQVNPPREAKAPETLAFVLRVVCAPREPRTRSGLVYTATGILFHAYGNISFCI